MNAEQTESIKISPSSMSDQELNTAIAEGMGWTRLHPELPFFKDKKGYNWVFGPCEDYNHCRVVEDWIWDNDQWALFTTRLESDGTGFITRSTGRMRCEAALAVMREMKGSK